MSTETTRYVSLDHYLVLEKAARLPRDGRGIASRLPRDCFEMAAGLLLDCRKVIADTGFSEPALKHYRT